MTSDPTGTAERKISVTVNGTRYERDVSVRRSLVDFIREDLRLTGSHVGCEHGVCGACTVLLDGEPIRGCLLLAVQAHGKHVLTIEGLSGPDGDLHPIQRAFWEQHGLQCGFCTPGLVLTAYDYLRDARAPSDENIRHAIAGNVCRCTGYQGIVRAIHAGDETWER